jgi:hypothetical protein
MKSLKFAQEKKEQLEREIAELEKNLNKKGVETSARKKV